MITDISQLDLNGSYTYNDYLTWQFEGFEEVIRGKIHKMITAPPTKHHQVLNNFIYFFNLFLGNNKKWLHRIPFDVCFLKNNDPNEAVSILQPDLCIVKNSSILTERGCLGAPDFIIEILSPSTKHKDLHEKFNLYEEFEVGEYWIVDPISEILDIFILQNGKYQLKGKYTTGDQVSVYTLPGLVINLDEIFTINS